jgi:very-short-patch-repair endonuclease
VYLELTKRGVRLQPQVGVCGYRVDLGILDPDVPGRFVCGIECDGVGYHSMETVRDRDRLRQQVLEDRGWIIYRVWSTDWFKDRSGQIDRLLALIQQARERVRAEETLRQQERVAQAQTGRAVSAATPTAPDVEAADYARPTVQAYRAYTGRPPGGYSNLLETPADVLADVIAKVVDCEAPVHEADVLARLCDLWDTKAGSRIQAAVRSATSLAGRQHTVQRRGHFLWRPDDRCPVRARTDTGIPGDRIAPEEYAEAIKLILAGGRAFDRSGLITETRAVMGFSRTGSVLEEAIGTVIDALVLQGILGEGSSGLMLRVPATATGA